MGSLLFSQTDKKREVLESEALSWASEHRLEYVDVTRRPCVDVGTSDGTQGV
jgi:hypothetical protein